MDVSSASTPDGIAANQELVIKSRLDELNTLSKWVSSQASLCSLSTADLFRLDLVLAEVVTNIMQNAYTDQAEHDIHITLHWLGERLQIQVRDDGVPFDPLQHPAFVFPKNLEEAKEGGLGIHLMRQYTDECDYRREKGNNILTLIFYLNQE